ncbi:MAG: type III pantothenate kinase, partial [Planctomycetota bacterium]|nr:type III pantothenate kinase [Planctomycetota bacterium]
AAQDPLRCAVIPLGGSGAEFAAALAHELEGLLGAGSPPLSAALCSVGEADLAAGIRRVLESAGLEQVLWPPPHGLLNMCRVQESVGLDRLFAARGALELVAGPALVVDAGTAVTVDALGLAEAEAEADRDHDHGDGDDGDSGGAPGDSGEGSSGARGVFLGGAIAPGPDLLAGSLARGTARLPHNAPRPGVRALGRDTGEALAAGVAVGFGGAVRALVEGVAAEAGLDRAPLVLTGGAADYLRAEGLFGEREVLFDEHLVGRGLAAALVDALELER